MAKHQRKVQAGLDKRKAAFNPGKQGEGLLCHMPGSQNKRKGWGSK